MKGLDNEKLKIQRKETEKTPEDGEAIHVGSEIPML